MSMEVPTKMLCLHGQLARVCQTCEDAQEIERLEAENAELRRLCVEAAELIPVPNLPPITGRPSDARMESNRRDLRERLRAAGAGAK